ncbi:MAG: hypothetical protein J3T61_06040 [Candidatus Brocadiales bacterium]|nr:hypothetical protein [Candidatus Bathyanammoxibius sp.]
MVHGAVDPGNDYGGRPFNPEFFYGLVVFTNVQFDGDKVCVYEFRYVRVCIGLGIQPFTAASVRMEEIQQQEFLLAIGLLRGGGKAL